MTQISHPFSLPLSLVMRTAFWPLLDHAKTSALLCPSRLKGTLSFDTKNAPQIDPHMHMAKSMVFARQYVITTPKHTQPTTQNMGFTSIEVTRSRKLLCHTLRPFGKEGYQHLRCVQIMQGNAHTSNSTHILHKQLPSLISAACRQANHTKSTANNHHLAHMHALT